MNILNDKTDLTFVSPAETEMIQLQKQEYHLVNTYLRTKGLLLFYLDPKDDAIYEAQIKYSNTIHVFQTNEIRNGKNRWIAIDFEAQKCSVDARCIYFEALNFNSAMRRVQRWYMGCFKELCNLRTPSKEGIKFF